MKILQDRYNHLLKRRELLVEVSHAGAGTPTRIDVRKAVAAELKAKIDDVYVVGIKTRTGTNASICSIEIYDSPELAKAIVPSHIVTRNLPKGEREKARREAREAERKAKAEVKPTAGRAARR